MTIDEEPTNVLKVGNNADMKLLYLEIKHLQRRCTDNEVEIAFLKEQNAFLKEKLFQHLKEEVEP